MVSIIVQRLKNWLNTKRLDNVTGNKIVISKEEYQRLLNHEYTLLQIRGVVYGKKNK